MTQARSKLRCRLQEMGPLARAAILLGVLLAAAAVVSPIAFTASGSLGLVACGFAFAVCALPSLLSIGVGELFIGPQRALYAMAVGMFLRLAVPLAACIAAYVLHTPLADGGLAFYVLALYPVMLIVETILTAARLESQPTEAR